MSNYIVVILLTSILGAFIYLAFQQVRSIFWPRTRFGFKGKIVYIDTKQNNKALVSKEYDLLAKPDFIFQEPNGGCVLVEYKSRSSGIYDSDLKQVYASAICARENGFKIVRAIIATKTKNYDVDLKSSNKQLYSLVNSEVEFIRSVNEKRVISAPVYPFKAKCRSCGYKSTCFK